MLRLILLRHAKASSPSGVLDIDRPLSSRGREAATRMGAYLRAERLVPDLALVSPSVRTRETWDLVRPALGSTQAEIVEAIYAAHALRLLDVVRSVPMPTASLLIVCHNPGCEELAGLLAVDGDAEARKRMHRKYPPAGLAVIDLEPKDWASVDLGEGRLVRFVTPQDLGFHADD